MQNASRGDNLHEMSKPIFWGKIKKKYFKMPSAEILLSMLSAKLSLQLSPYLDVS